MQLIVNRAAFAEILAVAMPIVLQRSTIPILSHVRIEAESDRVSVGANNLEASITHACTADVRAPGAIAMPANKLFDIAKRAASEFLSIQSTQDGRIEVRAGGSRYELSCLPADDFPKPFEVEAAKGAFRMPLGDLVEMLSAISSSIAPNDSRPFCNGAVLEVADHRLHAIGFAGHTFALCRRRMPADVAFPQIIIPHRTVIELIKVGRGQSSPVEVATDGNRASFKFGDTTLVSSLIDVRFPDWRRSIPKDNDDITITLDKAEIIGAVDRATAVLDSDKRRIGMHVNGQLTLSCTGRDQSRSEEVVDDIEHVGDDIEIGLDATYVRDAMNIMPGRVTWGFGKRSQSLMVRPIDDDSVFYIIMSMR